MLKLVRFSSGQAAASSETVIEPVVKGEHSAFPWTAAACGFLRFMAVCWITEAAFGIFVAIDMINRAPNMATAVQSSFAWAMIVFVSLTVGICMMAISELAILVAKYVTKTGQNSK